MNPNDDLPHEIYPAVIVPINPWIWALLLILLLTITTALWWAWKRHRAKKRQKQEELSLTPDMKLRKRLDQLEIKTPFKEYARDFYFELSMIVREYLEFKYEKDFTSLTFNELQKELTFTSCPTQKELLTFFKNADEIKFYDEEILTATHRLSLEAAQKSKEEAYVFLQL